MQKLNKILNRIYRLRFVIIGGALLAAATTFTLLGVKGKIQVTFDFKESYEYGEAFNPTGKALMESVKYEYKAANSSIWVDETPKDAGEYLARPYSYNGYGMKTYGEEVSFTITQKEIEVYINDKKATYGNKLALNNPALISGDKVTNYTYSFGENYYLEHPFGEENSFTTKVNVNTDDFVISDIEGNNKTSNYKITFIEKDVEIQKRKLKLTTPNDRKVYDSEALSKPEFSITSSSLASGDEIIASNYSSITKPGTIDNDIGSIVIKNGDYNRTDFYDITLDKGTLRVDPIALTLESNSINRTYNSDTVSDELEAGISEGKLLDGHKLIVEFDNEDVYIGNYSNSFTYQIYDENNEDVTDTLYNVESVDEGIININKYPFHIDASSGTKKYDGTALTSNLTYDEVAPHDEFSIIPNEETSITEIGTTSFSYDFDITNTNGLGWTDYNDVYNVNVGELSGDLTIEPLDIHVYAPWFESRTYNGKTISPNEIEYLTDGDVDLLESLGYHLDINVTNIDELITYYRPGTYPINYEVSILDENDNPASPEMLARINLVTDSISYAIITQRELGFTFEDVTHLYDGNSVLAYGEPVDVTGLVEEEGDRFSYITPSFTEPGVYNFDMDNMELKILNSDDVDVTDCYIFIDANYPTLTINKRAVSLTSSDVTRVYNGGYIQDDELYVTVGKDGFISSDELRMDQINYVNKNTYLATEGISNIFNNIIVERNGTPIDYHDYYYIDEYISYGEIKIRQANVSIAYAPKEEEYDGTEHDWYEGTPTITGEKVSIDEITYNSPASMDKHVNVGIYDAIDSDIGINFHNTILDIDVNECYKLTITYPKLTITKRDLVININTLVEDSATHEMTNSIIYDGDYHNATEIEAIGLATYSEDKVKTLVDTKDSIYDYASFNIERRYVGKYELYIENSGVLVENSIGNNVSGNYNITVNITGSVFNITPRELVIYANAFGSETSNSIKYDGETHNYTHIDGVDNYFSISGLAPVGGDDIDEIYISGNGYEASINPYLFDLERRFVEEYSFEFDVDDITMTNDEDIDVIDNYSIKINIVNPLFSITPRNLVITSPSYSKEYDGLTYALPALTDEAYGGDGLANNETVVDYTYTNINGYKAVQNLANTVNDNTVRINDASSIDTTSNYIITNIDDAHNGKINVSKRGITITYRHDEWVYDGEEHRYGLGEIMDPGDPDYIVERSNHDGKSALASTDNERPGKTLIYEYVSDSSTKFNLDMKINHETYGDVTDCYNITVANGGGTITITKKDVTINVTFALDSDDDPNKHVYDGESHDFTRGDVTYTGTVNGDYLSEIVARINNETTYEKFSLKDTTATRVLVDRKFADEYSIQVMDWSFADVDDKVGTQIDDSYNATVVVDYTKVNITPRHVAILINNTFNDSVDVSYSYNPSEKESERRFTIDEVTGSTIYKDANDKYYSEITYDSELTLHNLTGGSFKVVEGSLATGDVFNSITYDKVYEGYSDDDYDTLITQHFNMLNIKRKDAGTYTFDLASIIISNGNASEETKLNNSYVLYFEEVVSYSVIKQKDIIINPTSRHVTYNGEEHHIEFGEGNIDSSTSLASNDVIILPIDLLPNFIDAGEYVLSGFGEDEEHVIKDNTFIRDKNDNSLTSHNYVITINEVTLTIDPRPVGFYRMYFTSTLQKEYDGKHLSSNFNIDTLFAMDSSSSLADVDGYVYKASYLKDDETGNYIDVTVGNKPVKFEISVTKYGTPISKDNYVFTLPEFEYHIDKKSLVIVNNSECSYKYYDGEEFTDYGSVLVPQSLDPAYTLIGLDTVTFDEPVLEVGNYAINFDISVIKVMYQDTDVTDSFVISSYISDFVVKPRHFEYNGSLENDVIAYDGESHTLMDFIDESYNHNCLANGDYVEINPSLSDVVFNDIDNSYTGYLEDIVIIRNQAGENVTDDYGFEDYYLDSEITFKLRKAKLNHANPLTSKEYDGEASYNDTYIEKGQDTRVYGVLTHINSIYEAVDSINEDTFDVVVTYDASKANSFYGKKDVSPSGSPYNKDIYIAIYDKNGNNVTKNFESVTFSNDGTNLVYEGFFAINPFEITIHTPKVKTYGDYYGTYELKYNGKSYANDFVFSDTKSKSINEISIRNKDNKYFPQGLTLEFDYSGDTSFSDTGVYLSHLTIIAHFGDASVELVDKTTTFTNFKITIDGERDIQFIIKQRSLNIGLLVYQDSYSSDPTIADYYLFDDDEVVEEKLTLSGDGVLKQESLMIGVDKYRSNTTYYSSLNHISEEGLYDISYFGLEEAVKIYRGDAIVNHNYAITIGYTYGIKYINVIRG